MCLVCVSDVLIGIEKTIFKTQLYLCTYTYYIPIRPTFTVYIILICYTAEATQWYLSARVRFLNNMFTCSDVDSDRK